jgi:hypothetical protein
MTAEEADVRGKRIIDLLCGASVQDAARTSLLIASAAGFLLGSNGVAVSGPCTAQIGQTEDQIAGANAGTDVGPAATPTASQSVGAQLHHQPTPNTVGQAAHAANQDGDAAIERAKKADAAGDAAGCNAAVIEARRLYDLKD